MGTNFYIHQATMDQGVAKVEEIHIGKRSGGWVFGFQGADQKTVRDWKGRLNTMSSNEQIVDEYGNVMTAEKFWEEVEATKQPWGANKIKPKDRRNLRAHEKTDRDWMNGGFDFHDGEFC